MTGLDTSIPVLLLGGRENTLSALRNFNQAGVKVSVCASTECKALYSRHCDRKFTIPKGASEKDYWHDLLLSDESNELDGHIVFAFCDESLEFINAHHEQLRQRYTLQEFNPALRQSMLDKQETLRLASEAGIPTPNYWAIESDEDIFAIRDQVRFPIMIKPLRSHAFAAEFSAKLFIIENDFDEAIEKTLLARSKGHDIMVVEMIPGPDDLLSSYYTFMDKSGHHLFHYTKSVLRRWPVNRGGGCYHVSEWVPEVAALGEKFFDAIGWQGIANIEFKRDVRDGLWKVIEVNSRFTAAHRLVTAAGMPIDIMIYCHLTRQAVPQAKQKREGLRYWYPLRDFFAFIEMRGSGQLSFSKWVRSVVGKPKLLPYFSLTDPLPAMRESVSELTRIVKRLIKNRGGST